MRRACNDSGRIVGNTEGLGLEGTAVKVPVGGIGVNVAVPVRVAVGSTALNVCVGTAVRVGGTAVKVAVAGIGVNVAVPVRVAVGGTAVNVCVGALVCVAVRVGGTAVMETVGGIGVNVAVPVRVAGGGTVNVSNGIVTNNNYGGLYKNGANGTVNATYDGLDASNDQVQTIKEYLAKNFGQVNVNKADAAEIASVLDITPAQAEAIVKYRGDHGPYKSVDDVKKAKKVLE